MAPSKDPASSQSNKMIDKYTAGSVKSKQWYAQFLRS